MDKSPVQVLVTPQERAVLDQLAAAAGETAGGYLLVLLRREIIRDRERRRGQQLEESKPA